MRVVLFYQSLISDWNHGNAHFLRGIGSEFLARGHELHIYEPRNSWSVQKLIAEHGWEPLVDFHDAYPHLSSTRYDLNELSLNDVLDGANLVIVHEWNDAELIERVGDYRRRMGSFHLLFHDTHSRNSAHESLPFRLRNYDGVLACGQGLRDKYLRNGWTTRAWTWHEAADIRVFHPLPRIPRMLDLVWIGNWGDDENSAELDEFLIQPVKNLRLNAEVYGINYPREAIAALKQAGIRYRGWLPNYQVPKVFASARVTLHIPLRSDAGEVPGIRPFEALSCGIPLICSPWDDPEQLFTPEHDFLVARDGKEMRQHIDKVLSKPYFADELAINGLTTIRQKHTCAHRVRELFQIDGELASETEQLVATASA